MKVTIDISGRAAEELDWLIARLGDKAGLHARLAGEAEKFVKERGRVTSESEHRTANRLGATPTGHLNQAYQDVASESDADSAAVLVPRASRLRAAFGAYEITPLGGRKFLTIPANAAAYGKRAGEFSDLIFLRLGPRKTPVLARPVAGGGLEVMYFLTPKVRIKEDAGLIPFADLADHAADVAELYFLEERGVA